MAADSTAHVLARGYLRRLARNDSEAVYEAAQQDGRITASTGDGGAPIPRCELARMALHYARGFPTPDPPGSLSWRAWFIVDEAWRS